MVKQAGEPEAQVQVARVDLAQVVEDGELQRLLVQDEGPGVRQQHLVGEPGERGGEAGIDRGRHGANIIMAEKRTVSSSARTGTWKGAGRRWRGADGPGGRGGMFERVGGAGTCGWGPSRAAPNPSSAQRTFFCTFSQNPAPRRRRDSTASVGPALRVGCHPLIPGHIV